MLDQYDLQLLDVIGTLYQWGMFPEKLEHNVSFTEGIVYFGILKSDEVCYLEDGTKVTYGQYMCQKAKKLFEEKIFNYITLKTMYRYVDELPSKEQILRGINALARD